ncbi:Anaphase-promoting complex subunit 5 [Trinorchestia longiramus]|nr:Anaphase-promoting complex subunit 5 [Trinorchestia longiramus]
MRYISCYKPCRLDCLAVTYQHAVKVQSNCISEQRFRHGHEHQQDPNCGYQSPGRRGFTLCLFGYLFKTFFGEEQQQPASEDSPLILLIKEGIIAFHKGEHEKSETILHLALKMAQDLEDSQSVTYIFDVLANLALQRGEHSKAEQLFKSVLQRHAAAGGDVYGNTFVALSLKLAQCYLARGAVEEAIQGYHYCIAAQKEKIKSDPSSDEDTLVLYAMSLEQYARLLHSIGRYALAREHLQEALGVCVKVNGTRHLQTAVLKNDIGSLYSLEKRYEEAVSEIEESISIVHGVMTDDAEKGGDDSPEAGRKINIIPDEQKPNALSNLATYHVNLGTVELLRRRREAARQSCQEGVRLARKAADGEVLKEAQECLAAVKEALKEARQQQQQKKQQQQQAL